MYIYIYVRWEYECSKYSAEHTLSQLGRMPSDIPDPQFGRVNELAIMGATSASWYFMATLCSYC